jgi:hypothetical protein
MLGTKTYLHTHRLERSKCERISLRKEKNTRVSNMRTKNKKMIKKAVCL